VAGQLWRILVSVAARINGPLQRAEQLFVARIYVLDVKVGQVGGRGGIVVAGLLLRLYLLLILVAVIGGHGQTSISGLLVLRLRGTQFRAGVLTSAYGARV
jgi:hypothetical protein